MKRKWNLEVGNPDVSDGQDWFAVILAALIYLEGILPAFVAQLSGYRIRILLEKQDKD